MRYDGHMGSIYSAEHYCKTHNGGLFSNTVRWSSIRQLRKDRGNATNGTTAANGVTSATNANI